MSSDITNTQKNITMSGDTYVAPNGKQRSLISEWEGSNYSMKLIVFLIGLGLLPWVGAVVLFFAWIF